MEPHEKRVMDEAGSLSENIKKLSDFMHGDIFAGLEAVDQGLLMVQLEFMRGYHGTLARRLERFRLPKVRFE